MGIEGRIAKSEARGNASLTYGEEPHVPSPHACKGCPIALLLKQDSWTKGCPLRLRCYL